jgi:hypothetical protein
MIDISSSTDMSSLRDWYDRYVIFYRHVFLYIIPTGLD